MTASNSKTVKTGNPFLVLGKLNRFQQKLIYIYTKEACFDSGTPTLERWFYINFNKIIIIKRKVLNSLNGN